MVVIVSPCYSKGNENITKIKQSELSNLANMTLSVFVCMHNNSAFRGRYADLNKGEDTDYKFPCTSDLGCVKKTDRGLCFCRFDH